MRSLFIGIWSEKERKPKQIIFTRRRIIYNGVVMWLPSCEKMIEMQSVDRQLPHLPMKISDKVRIITQDFLNLVRSNP